jgi:hypothetical protein
MLVARRARFSGSATPAQLIIDPSATPPREVP